MKVLSLFDGISVARLALESLGTHPEYYASEIDNYAIKIARKNYPDTIQLGSVVGLVPPKEIDLLIGGSPCQDLSIAQGKGRKNLDGARSGLFYEYIRILKEAKPEYFVLENVASMNKESKDRITELMNVEPIMIDAALVSAQQRKRLFWTNIPNITQPEDRGLVLRDIVDLTVERVWKLPENITRTKRGIKWDTSGKGYFSQQDRAYSLNGKHPTLPTARTITKVNFVADNGANVGVLNWNEIERLQSLPDNYTDLGNENRIEKRGGVIGNAFNAEVIKHILSFLPPRE